MSELSERDKQILLGQGHTRDERIDALQQDSNTPENRLAAYESRKMSAVFVALTGIALVIGGFVLNGTTLGFEKGLGVALIVAAVLWYLYLRMAISRLRAT